MGGKEIGGIFVSSGRDIMNRTRQALRCPKLRARQAGARTSPMQEAVKDGERGTHSAVTAASNSDSGSLSSAEP